MSRYQSAKLVAIALLTLVSFDSQAPLHAGGPNDVEGQLVFSPDGTGVFTLSAPLARFGQSEIYSEFVLLSPSDFPFQLAEEPGPETMLGLGVAALKAANGDTIVAVSVFRFDPGRPVQVDYLWRESVTFMDGTVISSSGRFMRRLPGGLNTRVAIDSDGAVTSVKDFAKKIIIVI